MIHETVMMFSKFGALAILTLCFLVAQSTQDECVAQSVVDLRVTVNKLLVWNDSPGEPCDIDEYLVHIFHPDQPAEYEFSVKENFLNVSFLEVCEEWTFVVVPISGHTTGAQFRLVTKVPLPSDADLSLSYLTMSHNPNTGLTHLKWDLTQSGLRNCYVEYKIKVEEAGGSIIGQYYNNYNSLDLNFLSSCTAYQFGVRAVNTAAEPSIEGPLRTDTFILPGRKQYAPVLIHSNPTAYTVDLSFRLESKYRNPCEVTQMYIDGSLSFSYTYMIDINDEDRNPLNVTIDSLDPGRNYNFLVYVYNTVGYSPHTIVSIRTKDIDPDLS